MEHPTVQRKNKNKKKQFYGLKMILSLLWCALLLANTWTESLEQLLDFKSLRFKWDWSPNFRSFFYFYDLTLIHPDYVTVKLGHFFGFAIMDLLVFSLIKNHRYSIGISIVFAFVTEFFQLFFGRDGRLYDFMIDSLGVIFVYFILKKILHFESEKKGNL